MLSAGRRRTGARNRAHLVRLVLSQHHPCRNNFCPGSGRGLHSDRGQSGGPETSRLHLPVGKRALRRETPLGLEGAHRLPEGQVQDARPGGRHHRLARWVQFFKGDIIKMPDRHWYFLRINQALMSRPTWTSGSTSFAWILMSLSSWRTPSPLLCSPKRNSSTRSVIHKSSFKWNLKFEFETSGF